MAKITKELAVEEFNRFAEKLKIKARKLAKLEAEKDLFIQLMLEGNITIDDEGIATYKLDAPIIDDNENVVLSELKFRSRKFSVDEVNKAMGSDKKRELDKTLDVLALLTKSNAAFVKKIDSDEFTDISNSLMAFYLPR